MESSGSAFQTGGDDSIVTFQQHLIQQQREHFPGAKGSFSWLLSGLTLATKMIQAKVRRAGLLDVLGAAGSMNVQGEAQQKLDVFANQALLHCLGVPEIVAVLVSEENENPVTFEPSEGAGKYVIVFDPLDGSSNIDVNVGVGTIFSILRRSANPAGGSSPDAALQPGVKQVAAGYVMYGSSTILVYTAGQGVFGFTLDPGVGDYILSHPDIRMPESGNIYSVNEALSDSFPEPYRKYLEVLRSGRTGRRYSSRYVGSMVSDVHRTLFKGGAFLYPPTDKAPRGKLRLLYEANPIAYVVEQAGGRATDGERRILDIQPEHIHQRTPLVLGSKAEMDEFDRCRAPVS